VTSGVEGDSGRMNENNITLLLLMSRCAAVSDSSEKPLTRVRETLYVLQHSHAARYIDDEFMKQTTDALAAEQATRCGGDFTLKCPCVYATFSLLHVDVLLVTHCTVLHRIDYTLCGA